MPMTNRCSITVSTGGVITITLDQWMNAALAATFAAATVAGTVTVPNAQQVHSVITLTPGSPLSLQSAETDKGGSFVYGQGTPL